MLYSAYFSSDRHLGIELARQQSVYNSKQRGNLDLLFKVTNPERKRFCSNVTLKWRHARMHVISAWAAVQPPLGYLLEMDHLVLYQPGVKVTDPERKPVSIQIAMSVPTFVSLSPARCATQEALGRLKVAALINFTSESKKHHYKMSPSTIALKCQDPVLSVYIRYTIWQS